MSDYRPQVGDVVRRQGQEPRWIVTATPADWTLVCITRDSVVTTDTAWVDPAELVFLRHDEPEAATS